MASIFKTPASPGQASSETGQDQIVIGTFETMLAIPSFGPRGRAAVSALRRFGSWMIAGWGCEYECFFRDEPETEPSGMIVPETI